MNSESNLNALYHLSLIHIFFTKLFVNDMIDQKGLITSDMLEDRQVEQYLEWAHELDINYTFDILEGRYYTEDDE